jgi:hypothetical protein
MVTLSPGIHSARGYTRSLDTLGPSIHSSPRYTGAPRKNPPGGKCADLFGGPEEIVNPKKLNRLRSSIDMGGSVEEPARGQKKSQASGEQEEGRA